MEATPSHDRILCEAADGTAFYAAIGNDYRGEFRSVDLVSYVEDRHGTETLLTKLTFVGQQPPSGISMGEFEQLRSVAWMDACGQPGMILDHKHAGRPFLFAGLEECQFSSTLTAMDNTMYGCISAAKHLAE